jgi:hypothetical protein
MLKNCKVKGNEVQVQMQSMTVKSAQENRKQLKMSFPINVKQCISEMKEYVD